MSVRRKMLLPVVGTLLSLTLLLTLGLERTMSYGVDQLERTLAAQDRSRVGAGVDALLRQLSTTSHDYAWWDDTVSFLELRQEDYILSNFQPAGLQSLQVDLVMVLDLQGEAVYAGQLQEDTLIPPKPAFSNERRSALLLKADSKKEALRGLWKDGNLWWMVSAEQIRPSAGAGPVAGTLIMARILSKGEIDEISQLSQLLLTISPTPQDPLSLLPGPDGRLHTWVQLAALEGEPLTLELSVDRPVAQLVAKVQGGVVFAVLLIGLAITLLVASLLERQVVRPVVSLDRRLRSVAGHALLRHAPDGDELEQLADDVSELLTATIASREDLARAQARTWTLLDNLPAFVSFKDAHGIYLTVNKHFSEIVQRAPHAIEGRRDDELFPPQILEKHRMEDDTVLLTGLPLDAGEQLLKSDKGERLYTVQKVPIRDSSASVTGIVTIGLDITDRRNAEDAAAARSRFLANVGHEIRTPMNGILGMLNLLQDTPLNDQQQEWLSTIQESTESLLNVLNDLLDISKVEAGKMDIEMIPFQLQDELQSVVRLMRGRAEQKKISLQLNIGPRTPYDVVGDPTRLRQVLLNLISNAIKFTETGTVILEVDAAEEPLHPVHVRFAVKDTGIGISAEAIERLFIPFSQVDASTARSYGGTGLGLAISSQLVKLMGGNIGVESVPQQGSTFYFVLPFTARIGPRRAARPLRILVVDDNPVNRRVATRLLERVGHTVIVAEGGQAAVELCRSEILDVVLMDMEMPGMDGLSATKAIRDFGIQVPVIALTAAVSAHDKQACYDAGMNAFLAKPIQPARLYDVLERVCNPVPSEQADT